MVGFRDLVLGFRDSTPAKKSYPNRIGLRLRLVGNDYW